jgi:YD repeat-containing protein
MDRVVSVDSPDSGIARYVYDPAGNRIEQTGANGITKTFTYDDLNRITAELFADPSEDVSYLYDQWGSMRKHAGRLLVYKFLFAPF